MAGLVGGSRGEAPPGRTRIFENLQKISYENCKKCIIVAYFSKKLTKQALVFSTFGRKTQLLGKSLRRF